MGLIVWGNELLQSWGLVPVDARQPRPARCVFCRKIADEAANGNDGTFVFADDELVVFKDWRPAARRHYLVCPRVHVSSARALTPRDAGLARRMLQAGKNAIAADVPPSGAAVETRFGYHLPPFNSVDHLHMHAFALPFEPEWKERKYSVHPWARFTFKPAEEMVEELERLEREARGGPGAEGSEESRGGFKEGNPPRGDGESAAAAAAGDGGVEISKRSAADAAGNLDDNGASRM